MTNKIFRKLFAKKVGSSGENIAKNFLINNGFKVLEMNFHYSRAAEVDIIALKDDILHFVEVKTRSNDKFGSPLDAITQRKLSLITSAARYYIQNVSKKYCKFQIDVIGIMLNKDCEPEITFLQNVSF